MENAVPMSAIKPLLLEVERGFVRSLARGRKLVILDIDRRTKRSTSYGHVRAGPASFLAAQAWLQCAAPQPEKRFAQHSRPALQEPLTWPQRHVGFGPLVSHHSPRPHVTEPHTTRAGASVEASFGRAGPSVVDASLDGGWASSLEASPGGHCVTPQIQLPAVQRHDRHPLVGGKPMHPPSDDAASGPAQATNVHAT
ncbi:MAG: hypothetical protein M3O46_20590 [Myxococcota bacterium]|nr:hypothetical protein [Myxococcota bacterium]